MNRTISYCILIVSGGLVLGLSFGAPHVLSDEKNSFLKGFVNHEMLAVLGVILAITLASCAQIHLTLNQIEEKREARIFHRVRANVRNSAYWLISLFLAAVFLVVLKPLLCREDWSQSLFNGAALLIVIWTVLILINITKIVFVIQPQIKGEG